VTIGARTLIAPQCTLTGCRIGRYCYVATAAIMQQGATVGDHSRLGVGSIVHVKTTLPARTRVGMRHIAVATDDGFIDTADVELARQAIEVAGFFEAAFGVEADAEGLHEEVITRLLDEVHSWDDRVLDAAGSAG
jgi:hypothetical protein